MKKELLDFDATPTEKTPTESTPTGNTQIGAGSMGLVVFGCGALVKETWSHIQLKQDVFFEMDERLVFKLGNWMSIVGI